MKTSHLLAGPALAALSATCPAQPTQNTIVRAPIAAIADRVLTLGDGRVVREERNAVRATVESLRW